jgi:hypothetical protein
VSSNGDLYALTLYAVGKHSPASAEIKKGSGKYAAFFIGFLFSFDFGKILPNE